MSQRPTDIYSVEQIKAIEQSAIVQFDLSAEELMLRAGKSAFNLFVQHYWPAARNIVVLCGAGNNAGDGYVFARFARKTGLRVQVLYLLDPANLTEPAFSAAKNAIKAGVQMQAYQIGQAIQADVIVDALFGTGLSREVTGDYWEVIKTCQSLNTPILSMDVPSGLNADTGCVMGIAIKANVTLTFIGLKQGLLSGPDAKEYCGQLFCDDLAIPAAVKAPFTQSAQRLALEDYEPYFHPRKRTAQKGNFGHVLIMGGNKGMPGSVRLAGEAALRMGAGLVTLATRPEHISAVVANRPELMCHGVTAKSELAALLSKASVIVVGNGLGQDEWAHMLWDSALESSCPLVVDADALNILAQRPRNQANWILTPHPGEASRLLAKSVLEVQADRFASTRQLQQQYGGIVVLKGAGTLVKGLDPLIYVCDAGNPGMASAGMGDVLSGVIGGLLAQGFSLDLAAQVGVLLHSCAADLAASDGERGMVAMDVISQLRSLANWARK